MMSLPLYRSRVTQSFHRLSTLGPPLAFVMVSLSWSIAMLLYTNFILTPELDLPEETFLLPLALGLAAIGRDASEGLLPVLLTRPLRRSTYVLSHWAALGTVGSVWALLHLLLQWGLISASTPHPPLTLEVLYNALSRVSLCFGMAATLVCFSTRLPAWGNVLLWGVLYFIAERVLPGLGKDESARFAFTVRQYLLGLLMPELDFRRTFAATPISWLRLTTYFSNVSLLLLLGIHIFNQREVSYASR
ncbi:hypothetical protein [Archangium lansingense]|uniref:Uncharacterized protein n=1 Tax=Archangium lansingense TaxID=2995310 RepID=A0ABT4A4M5_9BACT|nr:hypothetical protein [Archangium lansinium]MCY1075939.1 hypothetical protein [Archangium lansinium]